MQGSAEMTVFLIQDAVWPRVSSYLRLFMGVVRFVPESGSMI
jgi:hypothetical protein